MKSAVDSGGFLWEKSPGIRLNHGAEVLESLMQRTKSFLVFLSLVFFPWGCGNDSTAPGPAEPAWEVLSQDPWIYGFGGVSSQDLFAVGANGSIFHYDGSLWSAQTSGVSDYLFAVWAANDHTAFAVGENGRVVRYNGRGWIPIVSGSTQDLLAVWGSSADHLFAAGVGRNVLQYRPGHWKATDLGTDAVIWSIWGSSGNDVFAVGRTDPINTTSLIFHFDGQSWTRMESPTNQELTWVWGTGSHDVYATGFKTVLHFDGVRWTSQPAEWTRVLSMWGTPNDIRALDSNLGRIFHNVGTGWTLEYPGKPNDQFDAAWGNSEAQGFACGLGPVLYQFNGNAWNALIESKRRVSGIWPASSTDVFLTTENGAIYRYQNSEWKNQFQGDGTLFDIWGSAPNDVYSVGEDGILHYDGVTWSSEGSAWVRAIWGTSASDVYAGGYNFILHFDGNAWTTAVSGYTAGEVVAIWGSSPQDVFFLNVASVLHYDGHEWTAQNLPQPFGVVMYGIWGASGSDVYCVGNQMFDGINSGIIYHYDGVRWSLVQKRPDWFQLTGIWGRSTNDVFAVGTHGRAIHYDGNVWSDQPSMTMGSLIAISGFNNETLFVGGDVGLVLEQGPN